MEASGEGAAPVPSSTSRSGDVCLNEEEQKLFQLLKDVVKAFGLSTVLRCAGGWVRDKLLGKTSHDIDIAIDNMTGEAFANRLNEYLVSRGEDRTHVAVIQSNPDQSKHLETAKVKVQGVEVDFVNLRSESYTSTSRIPEIEFGTAEQDALRRDFTINALFYNIGSGNVEDLTGKGLQDLRSGLIRTPLPALQTFMDDPLRVMRAIRFASRLDFELDQDIVDAVSTREVKNALETKVSRERISTEFESTLEGPNPKLAFRLIRSFQLLDIVLNVPENVRQELPMGYADPCISAAIFMDDMMKTANADKHSTKIGLLSALLLPLKDFTTSPDKKNKTMGLPEHLVGLAMKKKKDATLVGILQRAASDIHGISVDLIDDISSVSDEVKIKLGLAIRSSKDLWRIASALSFLLGLAFGKSLKEEETRYSTTSSSSGEESCDLASKSASYMRKIDEAAVSLKLDKAWQIRPLINGKEVMKILDAKGPIIGKATGEMISWQLAHPDATVEECKEWLISNYKQ